MTTPETITIKFAEGTERRRKMTDDEDLSKCPHCPAVYSTEEELARHLGQVAHDLVVMNANMRARVRDLESTLSALRTAGDALNVLASSYAGDTGLHENGHLWGVIKEWERVAAVAKRGRTR